MRTERQAALERVAEQIRRLQADRRAGFQRCSTGVAPLDEALGGGLALGCVHELMAPSEGVAIRSVALLAAGRAASRAPDPAAGGRWVLYVDAQGDFYPPAAVRLGVSLDQLLIVRAGRRLDALWVCELALRCRSVAAVIAPAAALDTYVSRRLQLAAEQGGGLGLLLRVGRPAGATFAATRLWFEAVGGSRVACRLRVSILKLRERQPPGPFEIELRPGGGQEPAASAAPGRKSPPPAGRRAV